MKRIFLLNHLRFSLDRLSTTVPRIRCSRVYGTKPNSPSIAPVNYVQQKLDRPQHTTESDIDWDSEMQKMYEEEKNHSLLDVVSEESAIDVEPRLGPSFNLAAYASKSPTLQELVKLGVNLYKIEKRKGLAKYLVGLEFERDMKEHIYFMNKVVGIDASLLGMFLTKNPLIFRASIDDLQTRINYLESKNFKPAEITDIVTRNPFWLSFSTRRIDARLGYFQREFHLSGKDVRKLTLLLPKLITYNMEAIAEMTFTVREELELSKIQTKKLLLKCPHIWITRKCRLLSSSTRIFRTFISHNRSFRFNGKIRHPHERTENTTRNHTHKSIHIASTIVCYP